MAYVWQRWMADEYRKAGLKVVEIDGWKNRGRPASTGNFDPRGAKTNHHTGTKTSASRTMPTLQTLIKGRSDLPGPLAQKGIGADGTVYVIAAGRSNHAGRVGKRGVIGMPYGADGNALALGDEVDTNGTQAMPKVQRDALAKVNAVDLQHFDRGTEYLHRHEDISGSGKWDIGSLTTAQVRSDAGAAIKALSTRWAWNPDVVSDLPIIQKQFQVAAGVAKGDLERYHGVAAIQNALNVKNGERLAVDGLCDAQTVAAWRRWETKHPGTGRATTPDMDSLRELQIAYRFKEPAPPKPPAKVKVRIGTHNVYVKRKVAEVNQTYAALLAKHRLHAVLLQETAQMYGKWRIPGYKVIQFAPKRLHEGHVIETSSNTVLVRNDVAVEFKDLLDLVETWKGPKVGAMHDPRAPIDLRISVEGKDLRLLDVHGPFTKDAVDEFVSEIVDWIEASDLPAVVAGDFNLKFDTVVDRIGKPARATVDGKAPDMVVTKGAKKLGSDNLGKQGSDDHAFKFWDLEI